MKIKNVFKVKLSYWFGFRSIDFMFGKLSVHYIFLLWRSKSWRIGDSDNNKVWKHWHTNPLFGVRKWDDGDLLWSKEDKRISICILYNNFCFRVVPKESLDIYYDSH